LGIDIGICTFRRPQIADTLRSLAKLTVQPEWNLRIIVADNDTEPSAQTLIRDTASHTGLRVVYIHAPARNISIARNACLAAANAPLLAFIDDDEVATPAWLGALVETLARTGADAVFGPVRAIYNGNSPAWMLKGDFHSTVPVEVKGEIITGYTCNVLFRREAAPFQGLRFREDLGRSGGEDTVFFSNAYKKGARIAYAPGAVVNEAVAPDRQNFVWLARRRFRAGQTHGLLMLEDRPRTRLPNLAKAMAKAIFCFAAAFILVIKMDRARYWILRGMLHCGVVARLLGKRERAHYG
jgi:succinoglycan biosynthesis protein ExoM